MCACVQVVKTMHKIAREAESAVYHKQLVEELRLLTPRPTDVTHTTALAAVEASVNCLAAAIVVVTTTGRSVSGIRCEKTARAFSESVVFFFWVEFISILLAFSR